MSRLRDRVFLVLVAILLAGPALGLAARAAFPSWYRETAPYLRLERRQRQGIPRHDAQAIVEGVFQDEVEQLISDHAPMRGSILRMSGALQRLSISQSAALFGYPVYPTYFGSIYLYEPAESAIWHVPAMSDPDLRYEERMRAFGEGIASVAARHPEMRFCIMLPAGGAITAINPAYDLMANPQYPEPLLDALMEGVGDASNVVVVSNIGWYEDEAAYFDDYFRTDHHWNGRGAARLYDQAAREMGLAEVQIDPQQVLPVFMGSYARNGLVPIVEPMSDIAQEYPGVRLVDPESPEGEEHIVPVDNHEWYDFEGSDVYADAYSSYYKQSSCFYGPGSGVALVICDSFAAPVMAPIAAGYGEVLRVGDLFQREGGSSLEAYLVEYGPNDVWIVGAPPDLMGLVSREPAYFD